MKFVNLVNTKKHFSKKLINTPRHRIGQHIHETTSEIMQILNVRYDKKENDFKSQIKTEYQLKIAKYGANQLRELNIHLLNIILA